MFDMTAPHKRKTAAMARKRKARRKNTSVRMPVKRKPWWDVICLHLAKVPTANAVFVSTGRGTFHVYSVIDKLREDYMDQLPGSGSPYFPGVFFSREGKCSKGKCP